MKKHCPTCTCDQHEAPADPLAAEVGRLRPLCRYVDTHDRIYREEAAELLQKSPGTLANRDWLKRLPVYRKGKGGAAMVSLADVAKILLDEK